MPPPRGSSHRKGVSVGAYLVPQTPPAHQPLPSQPDSFLMCHFTEPWSPHTWRHTSSGQSPQTAVQPRGDPGSLSYSRAPTANVLNDLSPLFTGYLLPA